VFTCSATLQSSNLNLTSLPTVTVKYHISMQEEMCCHPDPVCVCAWVSEMKPRALHILGECPASELDPSPKSFQLRMPQELLPEDTLEL
jgi:hypothetical protein